MGQIAMMLINMGCLAARRFVHLDIVLAGVESLGLWAAMVMIAMMVKMAMMVPSPMMATMAMGEMVVMVVMAVMVVGRTVSHVVLIVLVNFSRMLWLEKHIRTRSNLGFRATAPVLKAEPDAYPEYQSYSSLWPS